jgi:hypothetical protein
MGYFVKIAESTYHIPASNVDEAYNRFVKLNDDDSIKRGGGGHNKWDVGMDDPRPNGLPFHPAKWFSWMDYDYPSECKNAAEVLIALGFEVMTGEDGEGIFITGYDNKSGQEDIFLDSIFDLSRGSIAWIGEDDAIWETVAGVYEGKAESYRKMQEKYKARFADMYNS